MSGSVVIGQINIEGEEPGGLEEAHAIHFQHMAEGYNQLMNISGVGTPGCTLDEPGKKMRKEAKRPESQPKPFPTILYKPGGEIVVGKGGKENLKADMETKERLLKLRDPGGKPIWREEPYLKPQIAVADPASEKKALQVQNDLLQSQIIALADQLKQLQAAHEARN